MPKVSESHKLARRTQILDGARKAFARKGFQATTVRDLEAEIGLSSGAILSYYPSKMDIFVALAEEDSAAVAQLWGQGGLRAVLDEMAGSRQTYLASYLEVGRELLVDADFRRRWEERGEVLMGSIRESVRQGRRAGTVRDDVPVAALVTHCVVGLDGMRLQLRLGATRRQLEVPLQLFEASLAPA